MKTKIKKRYEKVLDERQDAAQAVMRFGQLHRDDYLMEEFELGMSLLQNFFGDQGSGRKYARQMAQDPKTEYWSWWRNIRRGAERVFWHEYDAIYTGNAKAFGKAEAARELLEEWRFEMQMLVKDDTTHEMLRHHILQTDRLLANQAVI